jgi:photosystem II stability/assembly factor-like uncharacterized protein
MKTNLIIIVFLLLNLCVYSQSTKWSWINPYPTGAQINQSCFLDEQNGFIIGQYGTLFHTTDGGSDWEQIDLDVNCNLIKISFSDNLNGRILGSTNYGYPPTFFRTSDGGNSWTTSTITSFQVDLYDMFFVNIQTGWCLGYDGKIFKTIDGGISWSDKSLPSSYGTNFSNILFRNESDGYLFGTNYYQYPYRFCLARTNDGGNSWSFEYGPPVMENFDSDIVDDSITVIVGSNGLILRSADNCDSWTFKMGNPVSQFYSVDFIDSQYGIAGADSGNIVKTTNGGIDWTKINTGYQTNLSSVQYASNNLLAATGNSQYSNYPYILTSTDQGNSWLNHTRLIENQISLTGIHPVDSLTTFICGSLNYNDGYIYKTNDGGLNWQLSFYTPSYYLSDIKALNKDTIFAAGGNYYQAAVLKSFDGGQSWSIKTFNSPTSIRGLSLPDPSALYAFNETYIYKSTDFGNSWNIKYQPANSQFTDFEFVSNKVGYCAGGYYPSQLHKTTDGGESWNVYTISSYSEASKISFPSENVGYACGWNYIYKSTDGGINWIQVTSPSYSNTDIVFNDEMNGWVATSEGIYATTDGGQNWQQELSISYNTFYTFGIRRGNSLWAIGSSCGIIKYDNNLPTSIAYEMGGIIPTEFALLQNYPNPFNPSTKIRYDIPKETRVVLKIYDVLGAEVATLVNDLLKPGRYTTEWNAGRYASGVYIYRIDAGNFTATRKLMLLK